MADQHVRSINTFAIAGFALLTVGGQAGWWSREGNDTILYYYYSGLILLLLIYTISYLLEPAYTRWTYRRSSPVFKERMPFDLFLLQFRFGLRLEEVIEFIKGPRRPAFSSGNTLFPYRLYLRRGMEQKLDDRQLQGLFAFQLAGLSLGRNVKIWLCGGTGVALLLLAASLLAAYTAGGAPLLQFYLSLIPVFIFLVDLLVMTVSRRLIHAADLLATRVLVYPDYLLRYLKALGRMEKGDEEITPGAYTEKEDFWFFIPAFNPYPSAQDRLGYLARYYPEAGAVKEKLKREQEEKKEK